MGRRQLSDAEYRSLLELRDGLRHFLHWSGERARAAGLTPAQHQLLLAVRGHHPPGDPTVGDVAEHLLLRHHSAVQLVDRAEEAGLVARYRDQADHRVVHVKLTDRGQQVLASLASEHMEELGRVGQSFANLSVGIA